MAQANGASAERAKAKTIRPLRRLMPFLAPYRWLLAAAIAALVVTAALALALPLAVRRVVDGFFVEDARLMDLYFAAAIGIAALLAIGTALRFYLVTRLGERVIADIRRAIYDKVIGMSPAFYERLMTGEVLSRLTTDTTLVLSVVGSSVSIALRNVLTFVGGLILLFVTSAKLTGLVLIGVPLVIVPILTLGRRLRVLSRENQDRIADSSAQASETLLAAQTVQAYTHERASRGTFGTLTEQAFDAARRRIVVRSVMTAIVIFLVFTSIVGVLWIGARDVRAGAMTPGRAGAVRDLRGDGGGLGGGALGDLGRAAAGGRGDRAHGRADRGRGRDRGPGPPGAGAGAGAGRDRLRGRDVPLSGAARGGGDPRARSRGAGGGDGGAGRALGGGQDDDLPAADALLRSRRRAGDARRDRSAGDGAGGLPAADRAGAAGAGDLRDLGGGEHPLRAARGDGRGGGGGGDGRRRRTISSRRCRKATPAISASAG
jgi:hypothetical protein